MVISSHNLTAYRAFAEAAEYWLGCTERHLELTVVIVAQVVVETFVGIQSAGSLHHMIGYFI